MVLRPFESASPLQSVLLFLAPPEHDPLGKLVNLVAEELRSPILGLPGFDWRAFDAALNKLILHERFQRALADLAEYDHIALATSIDEYPAEQHAQWLQQLCSKHAFALNPLAAKQLSLVTVGKQDQGGTSSRFHQMFEQTAQMLDMHFLGGLHIPCAERFRYARAVDPVIAYVDSVQAFAVN